MRNQPRRFAASCCFAAFAFLAIGCTRIPELDGAAHVPVSSVVQRIKCDLFKAILDKVREPDPLNPNRRTRRFDFLEHWSAKVHLTVIVDDTIALTPGATLNSPLGNGYPNVGPSSLGGTSIAAVSQNWSLGLGAGFTTEAVRQEDIEFFLTLSELFAGRHRVYPDECVPAANGILLESDLRLGEVFDAALQPIRDGILTPGKTNGPATTPPPVPKGEIDDLLKTVVPHQKSPGNARVNSFLERREGPDPLAPQKAEAAQLEAKAQALINNVIKPLVDTATAFSCLTPVAASRYAATANAAQATIQKIAVDGTTDVTQVEAALKQERDNVEAVVEQTRTFMAALSKCLADYKPPKVAPVEYDPIDVISQQVNFYLTATGNATPSWKLVRSSGPTAPMFAATRKDTNTLTIALGRPTVAPDGSLVASAPMNNAILSALIGQSFVLH